MNSACEANAPCKGAFLCAIRPTGGCRARTGKYLPLRDYQRNEEYIDYETYLMMVLRNLLMVPYGWIRLCYRAAHVDKYTEEDMYAFLKWIDLRANRGGNVHIDVHGVENLPEKNGFMFFPNHQGLYDVLAIIEASPRPFSVVAKKEIANIPFLKQVFACMKAYMIDREDVRQAMQIIINVTKEVKKEEII